MNEYTYEDIGEFSMAQNIANLYYIYDPHGNEICQVFGNEADVKRLMTHLYNQLEW